MLRHLLAIAVLLTISSCDDPNRVFEENVEIPNEQWAVTEKAVLSAAIEDTLSSHNFLINVRNTERYPYRNLYVFVKTTFPNGKFSKDTVGIVLADETGKWLGDGGGYLNSSSHPSNTIMYQYNRRFPLKGEYTFEIEQAMRTDTLIGIKNIGLRIEKTRE
jgi:gliding motility-associated lipoprotein GldH